MGKAFANSPARVPAAVRAAGSRFAARNFGGQAKRTSCGRGRFDQIARKGRKMSDAAKNTRAVWYYSAENAEQPGPLTKAEMLKLFWRGVVRADTLVRKEGVFDWTPAVQTDLWPSKNTRPIQGAARKTADAAAQLAGPSPDTAGDLPVAPLESQPVIIPPEWRQAALPVAKPLPEPPAPPVADARFEFDAGTSADGDDAGMAAPSWLHSARNYLRGRKTRGLRRPDAILLAAVVLMLIAANVAVVYRTKSSERRTPASERIAARKDAGAPNLPAVSERPRPAPPKPAVDGTKLAAMLAARQATFAPSAGDAASRPKSAADTEASRPVTAKADPPATNAPVSAPSGTVQANPAAKAAAVSAVKARDVPKEKPPDGRNEGLAAHPVPKEKPADGREDKPGPRDVPKEKPPTGHDEKTAGPGFDSRAQRRQDAYRYGATSASEAAVEKALQWLAVHQMPDGGWCFNHQLAPYCRGQCRNPGRLAPVRIAATAMGVLPFLGAGQTYQDGRYQQTVRNGLLFLMRQMQVTPLGGSLCDRIGGMYGHGLAAIALCEAYGMTAGRNAPGLQMADANTSSAARKKKQARQSPDAAALSNLRQAAQLSLVFISSAEDPLGGGWRYQPRMAGDTSVLGWQVMALCSGRMAYLTVAPQSFEGARHFLDTVQFDNGANYGYKGSERSTEATQAIGLLCRMYLGWKHDHPGLQDGVQTLSAGGPSSENMYYNYYATQVLHHYGGKQWDAWNEQMREMLVAAQAKTGTRDGQLVLHRRRQRSDRGRTALFHGPCGDDLGSILSTLAPVWRERLPTRRQALRRSTMRRNRFSSDASRMVEFLSWSAAMALLLSPAVGPAAPTRPSADDQYKKLTSDSLEQPACRKGNWRSSPGIRARYFRAPPAR